MVYKYLKLLYLFYLTFLIFNPSEVFAASNTESEVVQNQVRTYELHDCIDIALKNNHENKAADFALKAAEARHDQSQSVYWPQLSFSANYFQMDKDPVFVIPEQTYISSFPTQAGPMNIETIAPQQKIKLMDKANLTLAFGMVYPLFTGGKLGSLIDQAEGFVKLKKHDKKRSNLQIVYDVKSRYYGHVLAKKLTTIGKIALERMEGVLQVTEAFYKNGSGRIKKTDYLKIKLIVENMRAMLIELNNKVEMSRLALQNTMAVAPDKTFELSQSEFKYQEINFSEPEVLKHTFEKNTDWGKLNASLNIYAAKIREAQSEYFPTLALVGNFTHIENDYEYGVVSKDQNDNFFIGLNLQLPIFNGFLRENKIEEAKMTMAELEEKKLVLRDGLQLQINDLLKKIYKCQQQQSSLKSASETSMENVELTTRAYQNELLELDDVIEAQLIDSFTQARYEQNTYSHLEALANLELIVGSELSENLTK